MIDGAHPSSNSQSQVFGLNSTSTMSSVESATSYDYESHDVSTTLEKVVGTKSLFKGCVNLAQPFVLGYEQVGIM